VRLFYGYYLAIFMPTDRGIAEPMAREADEKSGDKGIKE